MCHELRVLVTTRELALVRHIRRFLRKPTSCLYRWIPEIKLPRWSSRNKSGMFPLRATEKRV